MNLRAITAPIACQMIRSSSKSLTDFKQRPDCSKTIMATSRETKVLLRGSIKSAHLIAAAIIGAAVVAFALRGIAQTAAPGAETTTQGKAQPLSGAELWTVNCNRCHAIRGPGEFTAAQWRTILMHMRVRANIPAAQAREIQKFLEAGPGK